MSAPVSVQRYPLTPLQAGMLFHSQVAPVSGVYIQQMLVHFPSGVDAGILREAWRLLVRRHSVLRTSFQFDVDVADQVVHATADMPFVELDLVPDELPSEIDRFLSADRRRGFDQAVAPLSRVSLIRRGSSEALVVWTYHHALLDGRSHRRVLDELFEVYELLRDGKQPAFAPPRPFHQHLDLLSGLDLTGAERHWRELLAGFEVPTPTPSARNGPRVESATPATLRRTVPREELDAFASHLDLTVGSLIHAAWAILLARYGGECDVVFGSTRSGRRPEIADVQTTVGLLINTVPVRADVGGERSVIDLLRELRRQSIAARPFDHASPISIQQWSDVPAGTGLYDTLVVVENTSLNELTGCTVELREQPHYAVTLAAYLGEKLELKLMHDGKCLDAASAERLLDHLTTLVAGIASANDSTRIRDLSMLTAEEHDRAVVEWNDTVGDFPRDRRIEQLFESQVDRNPSAVAIVSDGQTLTYAQLEARANRVARHLQRLGIVPGALVAVCMNRSAEMIVALLGILKSGAAYVPLDPSDPKDRLSFLLKDTTAAAVLTQARRLDQLPETSIPVVCLDADWPTIAAHSADRPPPLAKSNSPAYVIYTSGSTGEPKGVVLSHRAVVNILDWVNSTFGVSASDRILWVTSICFDLSVYDIFGMLAAGGSIRVASGSELRDPERLLEILDLEPITLWDSAPALLDALAPHFAKRSIDERSLRLVLLSGDWIPIALPDRIRGRFPKVRVVALGGATEAAIWSNYFPIDCVDPEWSSIPYGRSIRNARYYLLDVHGQPAPVGVPAELYIGGECLAEGYWNLPALTAERFIETKFGRLYRTGDRARRWVDGTIELLGRIDHQVKIRGYRIELGEVEAVLASHPQVATAVATIADDAKREKRLIAYIVPRILSAIDGPDVREYLAEKLPAWMVPARCVILDELPLNRNGKIDRRRLPALDCATQSNGFVAPRDPTERALAAIWSDILECKDIGIHDHFFEMGGHSLKASQVVSHIRRQFGRELSLATFLRRPTIAAVSVALTGIAATSNDESQSTDAIDSAPATPVQRQLWLLNEIGQGSEVYTIPYSLRPSQPLDPAALQSALTSLSDRYESLRTSLHVSNGSVVQRIFPPRPVDLPIVDLSSIAAANREPEADRFERTFARQGFDLNGGPLWRVQLLRLSPHEDQLLIAWHHAIVDGQSIRILLHELATLYDAARTGESLPLAPVQSWMRYSRSLAANLTDSRSATVEYWRSTLTPLPTPLTLPSLRARPPRPSWQGEDVAVPFSSELSDAIRSASRKFGVTPFVVLFAALEVLLHRITGQLDFAIGVPVSERSYADRESLVGPLINTLVLRTDLADEPTFRELMARVQSRLHESLTYSAMPFDDLIRELRPPREANRSPLFQVLMSYNPALGEIRSDSGTWTASPISTGTAKYDLSLWIDERPDGFSGQFEFSSDLFDAGDHARIVDRFLTILTAALADPKRPIGALPLMTDSERKVVLGDWNATSQEAPDRCVHELIAYQVRQTPNKIAVRFNGATLTYAELDRRANGLAYRLHELGVGPDEPVGLFLDRSFDMLVAALAVWKAGGAYLPLDPTFPAERIEFYLRDSQSRVVIAAGALRPPGSWTGTVIDVTSDAVNHAHFWDPNFVPIVRPDHLAYLIYTSGSTGIPKGVVVSHRALVNLLISMASEPGLTANDVMAALTTMSFDIHALELWLPFIVGATIELVDRETTVDGLRLVAKLRASRPTVVQATPTTWRMLRAAGWQGDRNLKALCGGEVLPPDLAEDLVGRVKELWNLYGPTETTVWSCMHRVKRVDGPVPIGKPIANTIAYILDSRFEPLPSGIAGELAIGGAGLARGYWNRPELTAERFIETPWGRLFRTGDNARWRADGVLEFLGRSDEQVKIRGHRIELGEIEAALRRCPHVADAAASVRDERLIGHVVLRPNSSFTTNDIRTSLRDILPEPMIPAKFVELDALPTTSNGKLDRRALGTLEADTTPVREYHPPRNGVECDLVAVWEDVLPVRPIGITDDFFDLGGHSYLAAVLLARIQQRLGPTLPLGSLFAAPTIERFAALMQQRLEAGSAGSLVPLREDGSRAPLFLIAGVGGHVFAFHKFARLLGSDQPAYGVKAIGVDGVTVSPDRMEQIAAHYATEIGTVRPTGPLVLGGYSIGAMVAFELALQLQQAGRRMGPLVVFDMTAPGFPKPKPLPKRILVHAGNLMRGHAAERGAYLRERLTNFRGRVLDALGLTRWNAPRLDVADLPQDSMQRVWVALREAQRHYRPQRRFRGRVLLFRAEAVPPWAATMIDDPNLGWGEWATDGVERFTVPGDHLDMFREQNLEFLAGVLREKLAHLD